MTLLEGFTMLSARLWAQVMNEKLRRWLEGRCRMRPDGTWLIEPVVLEAKPALSFVLPDEASKEAYLARAVRLGRVRLSLYLLILAGIVPLLLLNLLGAPDGSVLDALRWATPSWGMALIVLSSLVQWWMGRRLRRWLEEVGTAVGTSDSTRMEGGRTTRSALGPMSELMHCRPAWMVVAEMVAVGVGSAYLVHHATLGNARCRRSLGGLTEIPPPADLTVLCSVPSSILQLLLVAAFLTFMALSWRGWWRWNRRAA